MSQTLTSMGHAKPRACLSVSIPLCMGAVAVAATFVLDTSDVLLAVMGALLYWLLQRQGLDAKKTKAHKGKLLPKCEEEKALSSDEDHSQPRGQEDVRPARHTRRQILSCTSQVPPPRFERAKPHVVPKEDHRMPSVMPVAPVKLSTSSWDDQVQELVWQVSLVPSNYEMVDRLVHIVTRAISSLQCSRPMLPWAVKRDAKEEIWQWKAKRAWEVFSDKSQIRINAAKRQGKQNVQVWDNGLLHEVNFNSMTDLPGRQKIRCAAAPTEAERAGTKQEETRARQMKLALEQAKEKKAKEIAAARLDEDGIQKGLEAMVHPAFLDLKARFRFRPSTEDVPYREFVWQRSLDACEDASAFLVCLAEIYAEILEDENPEFPLLGTPRQCMAAVALAMSIAGAVRPSPSAKAWFLSSAVQHKAREFAAGKRSGGVAAHQARPSSAVDPRRASKAGVVQAERHESARPSSAGALTRSNSNPAYAFVPDVHDPHDAATANLSAVRRNPMFRRAASAGTVLRSTSRQTSRASSPVLRPASAPTGLVPSLPQKQKLPPFVASSVCFLLPDTAAGKNKALSVSKAWQDWAKLSLAHERQLPLLAKVNGSHAYLSFPFGDDAIRMRRLGGVCTAGWKVSELAAHKNYSELVRLMPALDHKKDVYGKDITDVHMATAPDLTPIDNAIRHVEKGERVAAVIICTPEKIGGPYFSGAYNGMEGDACMRSDLYAYLREAKYQAERLKVLDCRGMAVHVPEDGVTMLSNVTFFRDTMATGYAELSRPIDLPNVICVSLYNLNPYQATDERARVELKKFKQNQDLEQLKNKFLIMLYAATQSQVQALFISDQDCRIRLHVSAADLGRALGQAIQLSRRRLPKIVLSGSSEFLRSVRHTASANLGE